MGKQSEAEKVGIMLREELSNMNSCSLEQLLVRCSQREFVQNRKITLYGQAKKTVQGWDRVQSFSEWEKAICHPGLEGQLGSRAKPRRIGEALWNHL